MGQFGRRQLDGSLRPAGNLPADLHQNIYDPLVRRDKNLKIEPALATKWGQTDKTTWFFDIRPNVKFSDGTPLTADDIVFSLNRANGPGSNMGSNFASVKEIKKAGDLRVEVVTKYPDPLLAEKWAALGMMSKAWAEKNNALNSADMTKNEENFATRNAMGTGPFMLKERKAGESTVLVPNPELVGQADAQPHRGDLHARSPIRRPAWPRSRRATST
jgi:peptide/nickel transport system substrate-binding protein